MRLTTIAAAAVAAQGVSAFRDTSPFLLWSTSRLSDPNTHVGPMENVATAQSVKNHALSMLDSCPSDVYVVVHQPGLRETDLTLESGTKSLMPLSAKDARIQTRYTIQSVVGNLANSGWKSELAKRCSLGAISLGGQELPAHDIQLPQIITLNLPRLSQNSAQREMELRRNDAYVEEVIDDLYTDSYTIIYEGAPRSQQEYKQAEEDEQQKPYDMDEHYPSTIEPNHFKRNLKAYARAETGGNVNSGLPLFEKYTFFNSGIFMGGTLSLLLILILYIALRAISGLEVSYYAFSKEAGPAAQKKQQ